MKNIKKKHSQKQFLNVNTFLSLPFPTFGCYSLSCCTWKHIFYGFSDFTSVNFSLFSLRTCVRSETVADMDIKAH